MYHFPIAFPFLLAFILIFTIMVALVELGILKYAYAQMGIPPRYIFAILLLTLLGSSVNIPLAELSRERVVSGGAVNIFGMSYIVPVVRGWRGTVLAINVGGALIPIILSIYLIFKNRLFASSLVAIAAVTLITHQLARPVHGVGITLPIYAPPLIAALVALVLSRRLAAPLAYVAGSIGTLIGADLLNLNKVPALGAPVAAIGGAGTFDCIFLVGIVAVLLASVIRPRFPERRHERYRL